MRTPGGQVGAKLEGHAEVRLIIAAIIGSSLAVALWEFCRPRWQREFPALRRRLSNLGIWLANLVLAAFSFARPDTSRPELEAAIDVGLPSWPIVNPWSSFVMAFLLLDFALRSASLSACVPFLWRFHAMHHSDPDVDVTTSVRHHPIAYDNPRIDGIRRRLCHARQRQVSRMVGAAAAAASDHAGFAPHPPFHLV
jgi:hypothetical protein